MRFDCVQFFLIQFLCQEPAGSLWAPRSHFAADGPSGPGGGGWGRGPWPLARSALSSETELRHTVLDALTTHRPWMTGTKDTEEK